jgi:hypothetical protein
MNIEVGKEYRVTTEGVLENGHLFSKGEIVKVLEVDHIVQGWILCKTLRKDVGFGSFSGEGTQALLIEDLEEIQ